MTTITIPKARKATACEDGIKRAKAHLAALGLPAKTPFTIGDVAGWHLEDALWCLRLVDDPRQRVAAVMPAVKRASKYTTDARVHDCIAAIERWLSGDDTVDLKAASTEARAAADAAWAAARWAAADAAAAASWAAATTTAAATEAAAWAATDAADADAEREQQRADLVAAFPPILPRKEIAR